MIDSGKKLCCFFMGPQEFTKWRGQGDFRAISIALLPNLAKNKAFLQFWLCSTPAKDTPFQGMPWEFWEGWCLHGRVLCPGMLMPG